MNQSRVEFISDTRMEPPYGDSCSIINAYISKAFQEIGFNLSYFFQGGAPSPRHLIPIDLASSIARMRSTDGPDIRIFPERLLDRLGPEPRAKGKTVVFFHSMSFHPACFLQSDRIDVFCGNSDYAERVVESLLLYPTDFKYMRLRAPKGSIIGSVPLMVPAVETPDGYASVGKVLPKVADDILENKARYLIGHAVRPGKPDPFAFIAIAQHLDRLIRNSKSKKNLKIFVSDTDFEILRRLEQSGAVGKRSPRIVEKCFVPIERCLANTELTRLMRTCDFCLAHDQIVESFGIYPLESVLAGSPVYTNGIGNLRHLLPRGKGITVYENPEMLDPDPRKKANAYLPVAEAILKDAASGKGRLDCLRGSKQIKKIYGYSAFRDRIERLSKACMRGNTVPTTEMNTFRFGFHPAVRRWIPRKRTIISDFQSFRLTVDQDRVLKRVLGLRIDNRLDTSTRGDLEYLFREGVLSVQSPNIGWRKLPHQ